jgi:hypothetical protein
MATALSLLLRLMLPGYAAAGDNLPQEAIATAVQALRNGKPVTIGGEPLASRIVLHAIRRNPLNLKVEEHARARPAGQTRRPGRHRVVTIREGRIPVHDPPGPGA